MKNILILTLICLFTTIIHAQVKDCPEPTESIDVSEEIPVDFVPGTFTDDIWGTPVLLTDRTIFWVHGLNGEGDEADEGVEISWSQASSQTDLEYYANSHRPDYADVSLLFAADELKGDLEGFADADENSILIAHSQGSIVSRKIDEYYGTGELGFEPRTFGGIATFGGPHQGAQILNNRDDIVSWAGETCDALTAGPIAEAITTNFWLDLLLNENIALDEFQSFFCGSIENNIIPFIYKDYFSGITESYMVGSEELEELNSYSSTIPIVCFYGVETEPIIWNLLVHVLPGHEPNNDITYGPFGATNDETLADWANYHMNLYLAKYDTWDY